MTQWRLFRNAGVLIEHGDTQYLPVFGTFAGVQKTTESEAQAKAYTAYTFSDMRVNVGSLSGPNCTMHFRDDGADVTALDVSLTGSGWFETIASAAVVADSLVNYEIDSTGQMHNDTVTVDAVLITYEHASTESPLLGGASSTTIDVGRYVQFGTNGHFFNASADQQEVIFKRSQALNNLRINCTAAASLTATFQLSKDGAGSSTVTLSVTGTGIQEDTTGSDSYADGDGGAFLWNRSAGTATIAIWQCQMDSAETWLNSISLADNTTTRKYAEFGGEPPTTTADDNWDWRGGSSTAANLQCYVITAGSGTRDCTLRVASTNSTAVSISITTTGFLEDTTGSESIGDTDSVQFTFASTGTAVNLARISIELPWSAAGVAASLPIFQPRMRIVERRF